MQHINPLVLNGIIITLAASGIIGISAWFWKIMKAYRKQQVQLVVREELETIIKQLKLADMKMECMRYGLENVNSGIGDAFKKHYATKYNQLKEEEDFLHNN